jgi:hypothetical protein
MLENDIKTEVMPAHKKLKTSGGPAAAARGQQKLAGVLTHVERSSAKCRD